MIGRPAFGLAVYLAFLPVDSARTGEEKRPVPPGLSQEQARKEVRELFKPEYTRSTFKGKAKLARKLVDASEDPDADIALRFVLLCEARDLAADAGELVTSLEGIARLDARFSIDALRMKTAALKTAARRHNMAFLVKNCLVLLDEALSHRRMEDKDDLLSLAKSARRKTRLPWHRWSLDERLEKLEQQKQWRTAVDRAIDRPSHSSRR